MKTTLYYIILLILIVGCNHNDDNTIYIPDRLFHYQVSYSNDSGTIVKTQKLDLKVTDGFYPEKIQTQIIWELFDIENGDTIIYTNKTGVIDDANRGFFIHQPRIKDMYILSFADFPTIGSDVIKDSTLVIITEGTIVMAKQYEGATITKVKTEQRCKGKTTIELPKIGLRRVYYLESSATSEIGTIYGDYYFDKELGFVKFVFKLPDNRIILIELEGVNFEIE